MSEAWDALAAGSAALSGGNVSEALSLFGSGLVVEHSREALYYVAYQLSQAGRYSELLELLRPYYRVQGASPELNVAVLGAAVGSGDMDLVAWMVDQLQGSQNPLVAQAVVSARASLGTSARVEAGDVGTVARSNRGAAGVTDRELREWRKVHDSVQASDAAQRGDAFVEGPIPSYMGWAIFVALLVSLPIGVVGFFYAREVENALASGDTTKARMASRKTKLFLLWGGALGLLVEAALFVALFSAAGGGGQ